MLKNQLHKNMQETEKILLLQKELEALEFSEWTKEKALIKYTQKIPSFPITTHFIYWCNLGINIGSEQNKLRPAIIVRTHTKSPICTILPLTSVRIKDNRWYHIDLAEQNSTVLIEHLRNISKLRILKPQRNSGKLVRITGEDVSKINFAIEKYYKLPLLPDKQ